MANYRWEKGDKFVEIEFGQNSAETGSVAIINQNVYAQPPVEWRDMIPTSDKERLNSRINKIEAWAIENGFASIR